MRPARWFRLLMLVAIVGLFAIGGEAGAQVFKPRGAKTASRAAPPPAPRKAAPVAAQAATTSKKPTRTAGPTARTVSKGGKKGKAGKSRGDDDVKIQDDDDDVKITDE